MDLLRPLLLVLGMMVMATAEEELAKPARPHILLVVLDDVGRADTGMYGKVNIPMPNLVNLGKQGTVLENFYTQTVCSPTRSSLMTGQFPFRFGMQHFTTQLPGMAAGIPLDTKILPKLLNEVGYDTHMIGKWHCGYATWAHTPHHRGFNSYMGILQAQGDYYKHNVALFPNAKPLVERVIDGLDFWDNDRPLFAAVGNHSLDLYNHQVTKVLNTYVRKYSTSVQQQAHPLFVYLAHQTVHIPLQARRDEKERCGKISHPVRRVYCDMLVELDDSLGDLVTQYKTHKLWENTLVILLTDNGGMVNFDPKPNGYPNFPASQGSNYPLRGSKTTLFEGGVRSLALLSGGYLPSNQIGKRYKGLAHVVDLSATVLGAAGLFPLKRELLKLDGVDLLPLLQNAPGTSPRTVVPINLVNKGQSYSAIRFGKYKLIVRHLMFTSAMNWYDSQGDLLERGSGSESNTMLLFDLEKDDRERKNLATQHPELVQLGLDLMDSYVNGGDYMEPQQASGIHPEALPLLHGGAWSPFQKEVVWNRNFARQQARNRIVTGPMDDQDLEEVQEYVLVAGDNMERAAEQTNIHVRLGQSEPLIAATS
ncbi:hypothetical protein BASA81_008706 [Batrachochytrium salamandrivorans]|nr:hypothetical protein BASA81_008706 [Batrachochytrium salamandrivorans]